MNVVVTAGRQPDADTGFQGSISWTAKPETMLVGNGDQSGLAVVDELDSVDPVDFLVRVNAIF